MKRRREETVIKVAGLHERNFWKLQQMLRKLGHCRRTDGHIGWLGQLEDEITKHTLSGISLRSLTHMEITI